MRGRRETVEWEWGDFNECERGDFSKWEWGDLSEWKTCGVGRLVGI